MIRGRVVMFILPFVFNRQIVIDNAHIFWLFLPSGYNVTHGHSIFLYDVRVSFGLSGFVGGAL